MFTNPKAKGLRVAFPQLFEYDCEISCMDGWAEVLYRLCTEIQAYVDAHPVETTGFAVLQIKEKFGGLRFYCTVDNAARGINQIIRKYEAEADHTCEFCGAPGRLRRHDLWKTLCDSCDSDWHRDEEKRRLYAER